MLAPPMAAYETPARPRLRANFDLPFVLAALVRSSLITASQAEEITSRELVLKQRLARERGGGKAYDVSPVELVAAFAPPLPGKPGNTLDEDAISDVAAREAGVGYRKIDPLKLDMQLI